MIGFVVVNSPMTTTMMMNYMLGAGSPILLFAWVSYILLIVLMVLGIAALWKYITKK